MSNIISPPYTIRIFIPDGNPASIKVIDKMNWTGVGLEVSRDSWQTHRNREEFNQAGIYILIGQDEDSDLPVVYIGQGDGVRSRIDAHHKTKLFWDKALVFTSSNGGLNRAHITWLEWALINKASEFKRCRLDNKDSPKEPVLTEYEKADTTEFLREIISVLPLVDVKVFVKRKVVNVSDSSIPTLQDKRIEDTIVVPAQEKGFRDVFLGEDCWYAIRIGGGKLNQIKYIAAYQTAPISAITHYAEVESIEDYGDGGKYKLNFKGKAVEIAPIKFGNAKAGAMQGPRYSSISKLLKAKVISDL